MSTHGSLDQNRTLVGAESIIMDNIEGVSLSHVWDKMRVHQKPKFVLATTNLQKEGLRVSFSHYGSLSYAGDMQSPEGYHYVMDGMVIEDLEFAIGPSTGRDWSEVGRSALDIERGPWASLTQYPRAIGLRETRVIQSLQPGKQNAFFCGPKLYQPNAEKKLIAREWHQKIVDSLIPQNTAIANPYLWHDDLHDENVFVDLDNPGKITGIIDWQSCHISPLLNPAFLDWDDLEPESPNLTPEPAFSLNYLFWLIVEFKSQITISRVLPG